jgi:hypothetical protein
MSLLKIFVVAEIAREHRILRTEERAVTDDMREGAVCIGCGVEHAELVGDMGRHQLRDVGFETDKRRIFVEERLVRIRPRYPDLGPER